MSGEDSIEKKTTATDESSWAFRYNIAIMSAFESVHSILQEVSKGSALALKLSEVRLQHEWEGLVGQTIAKHSYPENIRYNKLYLMADNSIWLQQLVFLKATLLEGIHSILPDLALTDIILRIGSIPEKHPAIIPTPLAPSATPTPPLTFCHSANSTIEQS